MSRVGRKRVPPVSVALWIVCGVLLAPALVTPSAALLSPATTDLSSGSRPTTPDTLATLVPNDGFVTRIDRVTISGVMDSMTNLVIADLTIPPGQYTLRVSFTTRLVSAYNPVVLRCGVIDNNGTRQFLAVDQNPIESGRAPDRHRITAVFGLPDVTLGLRCFPSTVGLLSATFDGVVLAAVPR